MPKKSKKTWLWEFSKRLVVACSIFYFVGVAFICVAMCVSGEFECLSVLTENLHDMLKVCVFGYFVKAGIENTFKIRKSHYESEEEV